MPDEILPTPPPAAAYPPAAYPAAAPVSDLKSYATRVKVLGILLAVFGLFCLISLTMFAFVGHSALTSVANTPAPAGSRAATESPAQLAAGVTMMGALIKGQTILNLICAFIAAIGLLGRHAWGRIATIVASVPLLLGFPFGTILAAYAIYLMVKAGSRENYSRLAASKSLPATA